MSDIRLQTHRLGDRPLQVVNSKAWMIVRRADFPGSMPFVISRREWDSLQPWNTVP